MVDFLLEVGTEELPADFVSSALSQWNSRIAQSLKELCLGAGNIAVYGTPRRLAVLIEGLPEEQVDRLEEIKGPPATTAFKDGKATPAGEGFAKKQGVAVSDLEVRETDKGAFVFVKKVIRGKTTAELLPSLCLEWISKLEGKRFMRWGDGEFRFPRPIRWLVSLLDDRVLPLTLTSGSATITSDRMSQGHRVLSPYSIAIPHAKEYVEILRQHSIEVDPFSRQTRITEDITSTAQKINAKAEISPELLREVTQLVEYPTAVLGTFESEYLSLPSEVITTVMVTHQRYFPLRNPDNDSLLPHFVTIANGDPKKADRIAEGNARVIRARLADAQFFYKEDSDEPLDSYLPQLETVTFQEGLGTMRDKVDRIMEISALIMEQLPLTPDEKSSIESTGLLCKADLVTQMVYEFPELQGIMGEQYARLSGESELVAKGIFEHYLPRNAGDSFPESITGQVVGIADRLDTLVSIFGLGLLPTGSSDPFALRRSANAIINIIWSAKLPLNLESLLEQTCHDFMQAHPEQTNPLSLLKEFFIQRLSTLLKDDLGIDYDLVNAVLGDNDLEYTSRALQDLLDVKNRGQFLQAIRTDGTLAKIYETVNRSTRLASKGELNTTELNPVGLINPQLFEKSSENEFYKALQQLVPNTEKAQETSNYQLLISALVEITPAVSQFFDGENSVLVMAEDLAVQKNRLNLLGILRNHARIVADFGAIVKS